MTSIAQPQLPSQSHERQDIEAGLYPFIICPSNRFAAVTDQLKRAGCYIYGLEVLGNGLYELEIYEDRQTERLSMTSLIRNRRAA